MALNAAEEETIESLKKWWNENGKQLVAMVVVVFAGYTGWLLWQNSTASAIDAASDLYEEILELGLEDAGSIPAAESGDRIIGLAEELKAQHGDSVYALFGSLFAAQQQVAVNDLAAAEASLQWVLDNQQDGLFRQTDEGLILTATLRLGRVILAQGENEKALALVNSLDPGAFEAGYAELRGDIYLAMDRSRDARDAYVAAQQAGSSSTALRMKLDNLSDEG